MDSGDLKQSELEEQIRRVNELIHQTNDLENQVRQSPLSETDQYMQLQLNQALMEAYQTSKQELEEKLQKLIAFHASSPRIFSEIARLKQAIDQGLAQTKTAWNPTSGTFMIPSQEKLAWANTIRAFQKKKEAQEEPDTTGRTYTRIDLGNGTYVWAWSKDGRTLTQDDIQFTVKHDIWAGKDGGLGKMFAQAEAMKAEAKGFKFIAEGMEDINKLNKKADKVKEAEKSTKKASGANDFKFGDNIKNHLKNVENVNTKKGVIGGHNLDEFNNALTNQGVGLDELILSKKPHPSIEGIYEIEYRIPKKDITGNVAKPITYKNIDTPKTVYDPSVFSETDIYNLGVEAMQNGKIIGGRVEGTASNGLKFIGYLDEVGNVKNFSQF